ncbi:MAG: HEAT repeat domain-containing protein, partial [Phycisphaerae bacterium]
VRRNAALVFGFMNSKGAVKMLARAMSDRDEGVRHYALEALSRQGNPEAQQELVFMTNSGVGSEEVFALQALGAARATECNDTFRYKLANAVHMETKLAAAWALGRTGSKEGVSLAKRALMNPTVRENDMKDPIADQVARVRIMAATALGAMGDPSTLKVLASVMSDDADPRLVQAAARAIVEILRPLDRVGLPFGGLKE